MYIIEFIRCTDLLHSSTDCTMSARAVVTMIVW